MKPAIRKLCRVQHPSTTFSESKWESTAIQLAVVIAKKRGIKLPDGTEYPRLKPRAQWSGVNRHRENGGQYFERRIRAVEWGFEDTFYKRRKNVRRGGLLHNKWKCELEIELPYWDFVPEVIDLNASRHLYESYEFREHIQDFRRFEY
jgi:hypothetical protein